MVSYRLSEEQEALRQSVGDFARAVVAPVISGYYERAEFPYDIVARMAGLSALQDTIDQGLAPIWAAALQDGPDGLRSLTGKVEEDLARGAPRDRQDGHARRNPRRPDRSGGHCRSGGRLEGEWRQIQAATMSLAGRGSGGLGFRDYEVGP